MAVQDRGGGVPTAVHGRAVTTSTTNRVLLLLALAGGVYVLNTRVISVKKASSTPPATGTATPPSSLPKPTPVQPPAPASVVPWNRDALVKACLAAIYREVPQRRLSPAASSTLAVNMVTVAHEEGYPLDLLLGQALCESDLQLLPTRNKGSGAMGPMQVTAIACAQVGMSYPIESPPEQLRAGIRYMKWLRGAYAQCRTSPAVTMQHYGMGRGTWLKFADVGCSGKPCTNASSVWREECGCGRGYSKRAMAAAARHPELHTAVWW